MLSIFLSLLGVFIILVAGELLWKNNILQHEYHRKFVHIGVGVWAATWPWLISWRAIQVIGLVMALVVYVDRKKNVFKIDSRTKRQTYGDVYFALAITLCALVTTNKIFFLIGMLHLAVADGLAAIAGKTYGGKLMYEVLGEKRSVIGTMAFWLTSMTILGFSLLFVLQPSMHYYIFIILGLPPALSVLENIGVLGLDNILVPFTATLALKLIY